MRVLYVDNDKSYFEKLKIGLRKTLEEKEIMLDYAGRSSQALKAIDSTLYDIVITDDVVDPVKIQSPEEYLEEASRKPRGRDNFYLWKSSDPDEPLLGPEDYMGIAVAKAAKASGAYVIGVSPEPGVKFSQMVGGSIDVTYKKPFDLMAMQYLLTKRPTQEEFERFLRSD